MHFEIYNAQSGGALLWDSGNSQIAVLDGLFEARLEITTDIFNGEELWVAQTINGELLTPRQEILPAPMAHTLRPGAIVKGTASAIPNNYLLDVQMNNDAFGFNRGAIFAHSRPRAMPSMGLPKTAAPSMARRMTAMPSTALTAAAMPIAAMPATSTAQTASAFTATATATAATPISWHRASMDRAIRAWASTGAAIRPIATASTMKAATLKAARVFMPAGPIRRANRATARASSATSIAACMCKAAVRYFDAYFGGTGGISANGIVDRAAKQPISGRQLG